MSKKALSHFKKVDPKLFTAAKRPGLDLNLILEREVDYFADLCRIIVGQQLSGKAARSIWERFIGTFPRKKVTARAILARSEDELRSAGMAYAKARALRDLADKTLRKEINWRTIDAMEESAVHAELIKVKGVGPWTIEMFLMFSLGREDVFSYGDLGLQKGIQKIYGLRKKPSQRQLETFSRKWSPYRTYAALVLWHAVDTK